MIGTRFRARDFSAIAGHRRRSVARSIDRHAAIARTASFTGRIDLVITDVVMPEMNGRDLANQLQELQPDMHRLFMSGYTSDVIVHQGVLDPGVHFIPKPFTKQELGAKVLEALDW